MRSTRSLILAAAIAAATLLPSGTAAAATYPVRTCDTGSLSGWSGWRTGLNSSISYSCGAAGGALSGSFDRQAGSFARWTFAAPTDTSIAGFAVYRAFSLGANQAYGTAGYALYTGGSGNGYSNAIPNFGGAYYSGAAWESASGLTGQTTLSAEVSCGGGGDCTGVGGNALAVYQAQMDLRDSFDPQISSLTGNLAAGGTVAGSKGLSYTATDRGGGVFKAALQVDGTAVQTHVADPNNGTCAAGLYFREVVPCALSASNDFTLDTTTLAEGSHTVRLAVRDATDVNETLSGPISILVDNIPAPRSTSLPLVTGSPVHGQALVADTGGWNAYGVPMTVAYRWQRLDSGSWQDVTGATGARFVPGASDVGHRMRVRVTATSSEGSTEAFSEATEPVRAAAAPVEAPAAGVTPGGGSGSGGGAAGGAQTLNGVGATASAAIAAQFVATRSRTMKARYGKVVTITGTLRRPDGAPIVGARLDVTSQEARFGSQPVSLGQVATDADGVFRLKLPTGPSRTIRFGYKAVLEATSYAQTTEVVVQMLPSVSLRTGRSAVRNGQSVAFTGRVAGAPRSSKKVVEMQARDGKRWRTFATVRLSATGRFKYSYRFTRTFRSTTYRFRALVKAEQGWPFLSGSSKARTVKVRA